MKAVKYLIMGAMILGIHTTVLAQDYQSLIGPITNALKADPTNPNAGKDLVKNYLKLYKKNPEALVALGNTYLSVRNYTKANEMADMAIKKNKNFGDAYVLKGDAEALQDDGGNAALWYEQAMHLDPTNPHGYISYANVYRKRDPQLMQQTMDRLKQAVPGYPVDAVTGHAFFSTDLARAYENYAKADVSKLDNNYLYEYVQSAYYTNHKEEALQLAKRGMQKNAGDEYESYYARFALYSAVDLEKMDEAKRYLDIMKAADKEFNAKDHLYFGQTYISTGQFEDAIAAHEKSLSMDEKAIENYRHLSTAHKALGNEEKQLEYSERYLSVAAAPKPSDFVNLANAYLAKAKAGDTDMYFEKAMGVYDNMAAKYPTIASWAWLQQANEGKTFDKMDYAISKYKEVVNTLGDKADRNESETSYLKDALTNLGVLIWNADGMDAAKPYYQKLIEIDPNNETAKKVLGLE